MRDDRNPEPLTSRPARLRDEPSAIDRELADALAVEPSPDFVARVRVHVANEPPPRRAWAGWTTWMPVTAGVLVAATVVLMIVVPPHPKVGPAPGSDRVLSADPVAEATPAPPTAPGVTLAPVLSAGPSGGRTVPRVVPGFRSSPLGAASRTATTSAHAEPEVLISQDEAAALRQLMARAGEGRLVVGPAIVQTSSVQADALPPEISIALIKIDPLNSPNGEEGVRQ